MNYYEWPEAHLWAVKFVTGTHHCGVAMCCGPISQQQLSEIDSLAANLAGLDEYPQQGNNKQGNSWYWD